jgi:hypothetical protein
MNGEAGYARPASFPPRWSTPMLNKTVRVRPWGKDQGDFVEVNEAEFDPSFHVLLDAEPPADRAKLSREEIELMSDDELRDYITARSGTRPGSRSKRETLIERALEV